jgi:hypothetical protein
VWTAVVRPEHQSTTVPVLDSPWSSPQKTRFRKFWRSYLDLEQKLVRITNPVSDLTGDQAGSSLVGPPSAAASPRKVCIEVLSESNYVYFTNKIKNNCKSMHFLSCFLLAARFTSRYISGKFITVKSTVSVGDSSLTLDRTLVHALVARAHRNRQIADARAHARARP